MKSSSSHSEPSEQEIQHAAYYLWLQSGRPAGRDVENWLAARELLRHRATTPAGSSRGRRTAIPPSAAPRSRKHGKN